MKRKGISLIVLVITIVVIIILASVVILNLTKNNPINDAKRAKLESEISREKEILGLSVIQARTKNLASLELEKDNLEEAIKDYENDILVEEGKDSTYIVTFLDSNRQYNVDKNSNIEIGVEKIEDEIKDDIKVDDKDENIYYLQSIEDLVILSNKVNAGQSYEGKTFYLEKDLDFYSNFSYIDALSTEFGDINKDGKIDTIKTELTTGSGFPSIGKYNAYFNGNINGNGKSIKNLYIGLSDNSSDYTGFIGVSTGIIISNLNLLNVDITSNSTQGIAAFVGQAKSGICEINNCKLTGTINSFDTSYAVAGFLGNAYENVLNVAIYNCYNYANIEGESYVAGILGNLRTSATIQNCENNGLIKGEKAISTAGILGYAYTNGKDIIIENCKNNGKIQGESYVSGIVPYVVDGITKINKCCNTQTITGNKYVAGITSRIASTSDNNYITNSYNSGKIFSNGLCAGIACGINGGTNIENCYNTGDIEDKNQFQPVAGIASNILDSATIISNCYNKGKITSKCNKMAGIATDGYVTIKNSYNIGKITCNNSNPYWVGAICSEENTKLTNCWYLASTYSKGMGTTGVDTDGIVSSLETESIILKKMNEYLLTFEEWKEGTNGYPILSFQ